MSYIISLFKSKDLLSIKKKFITLYMLNVADIVFTLYLVNTGMYHEINLIMASIIENELLSIIIKVSIPLLLLIIIYKRMKKASEEQLFQSNIIITVCLVFYGLIDISHIIRCVVYKL